MKSRVALRLLFAAVTVAAFALGGLMYLSIREAP